LNFDSVGMRTAVALLALAALAWTAPPFLDPVVAVESPAAPAPAATPELIERGRLLALAGNCAGCHTARGGAPYAGGRAIETPFGTVYAGNLTPDPATGLGEWSAGEFWRALHHGQGRDGRRLVPAFPYTETTRITRADSDALHAWLRTLPAEAQAKLPHELRWPYGTQTALATWRLMYLRTGEFQPDPARSAAWNRGAYLVEGVAHCVACHGGRNWLGGTRDAGFGGGLMAGASDTAATWYAPALNRADEAGVADWPLGDIVALLRDGAAPRGRASGPMAEVVRLSTQYLPEADLRAMADFLQALPAQPAAPLQARGAAVDDPRRQQGAKLYADHCAACHGDNGEGGESAKNGDSAESHEGGEGDRQPGRQAVPQPVPQADPQRVHPPGGRLVVPALAGNRLITLEPPGNLVRAIALGGFGAATAARPRPYGMPPYAHVLNDEQIGAVATYLRSSWGASAAPVSSAEVARWRGGS
jgi:mono/diheme cytochrome c family protein